MESRHSAPGGTLARSVARLERVWDWGRTRPHQPRWASLLQRLAALVERRAREQGNQRVAQLCGVLQVVLTPVLAGQEEPTGEFRAIVDDYVRELCLCAGRPQRAEPRRVQRDPSEHCLLAFGLGSAEASELARRLEPYGYALRVSTDAGALVEEVRSRPVAAVLADLNACATTQEVRGLAERLRVAAGGSLPLIGIGREDTLSTRLLTARCGMDALLARPLDFYGLVDRLEVLLRFHGRHAYNVALVPAGPKQAAYFSGVLEGAGMGVAVVERPETLLECLDENSPDLVLMDVDPPGADGVELAGAIRQMPRYSATGIVLMGVAAAVGRRLDYRDYGGDDFLMKPVAADELIRVVTARARRARAMQAMTGTDGLTGLLTQSRIKEELAKELARAARRGAPLAVAMIDIDGFKGVNDTHGHPVGDQVIRSLARLLVQRLRGSDYIGRYGGEEFVVVMPDARLQDARRAVEEVRERFATMSHGAAQGEFRVTFSAGIAAYPDITRPLRLVLAADRALYAAKRAGRNRVVVAKVGQQAA